MKVQDQERKRHKLRPKHLLWGIAPVAVVTPAAIAIATKTKGKSSGEKTKYSLKDKEVETVIQEEVDKFYSDSPEINVQLDKQEMVSKIQERVKDRRPATLSWMRKFVRRELADLVNSLELVMTHAVKKAMMTIEHEQIERLYAFYLDKWTEAESIEEVQKIERAKPNPDALWVLYWNFKNPHEKRPRDQIVHKDQLVHLVTDIEEWIATAKRYNNEITKANQNVYKDEYRKYSVFWEMADELKKQEADEGVDLYGNPYHWLDFDLKKQEDFSSVDQIAYSSEVIKKWLDNAHRYNEYVERQNEIQRR